jgi:hypothetical protein
MSLPLRHAIAEYHDYDNSTQSCSMFPKLLVHALTRYNEQMGFFRYKKFLFILAFQFNVDQFN